jgi:ATP-dependent Clp protease ATP-binding subunit ClpA
VCYHTFVVNIGEQMRQRLFGQDEAVRLIDEQLEIAQSGLADEARPPAVFMLYGPTGAGKTHTVETLAEVLHGNRKTYIRIDCGELQLEHEIAKVVGAPPGYLGHRETHPLISQNALNLTRSDRFPWSILLFDEVEKASRSMHRLMLGIMDKGILRTNDGNTVNFRQTMIFMTSNLGLREVAPAKDAAKPDDDATSRLLRVVAPAQAKDQGPSAPLVAVDDVNEVRARFKAFFSPEFINRLDCFIPYKALSPVELNQILTVEFKTMQARIVNALGVTDQGHINAFVLDISQEARDLLVSASNTPEWGARELRRVVQRRVTTLVSRMIVKGQHPPGGKVMVVVRNGEIALEKSSATTADLLQASIITAEWRKQRDESDAE